MGYKNLLENKYITLNRVEMDKRFFDIQLTEKGFCLRMLLLDVFAGSLRGIGSLDPVHAIRVLRQIEQLCIDQELQA